MSAFLTGVLFTPTAGGTTDWTVSTAVQGYRTPAAAGAVNGTPYAYRAFSSDLTQWEIGFGNYSSGVLARTSIIANSAGTTAKINFTAVPNVAIVEVAEDLNLMARLNVANTFSAAQTITDATDSTSPTTGALKVTGGIGAQGGVSGKKFIVGSAPQWAFDSSAMSQLVPDGSSLNLPLGAGLVLVGENTSTGAVGLFMVGASSVTLIAQVGGTIYSATPAVGKISMVYFGSGPFYYVYNQLGTAVNISVAPIRVRIGT